MWRGAQEGTGSLLDACISSPSRVIFQMDDSFTFIQILNHQRRVAFNIRAGDETVSVAIIEQSRLEHGLEL